MAADDMLSWLRSTIEGDKAVAEENLGEAWTAADDRDGGFFINMEDAGSFGKACGCCITGTLCEVEAKHIALHDPRDTIARCEAELKLLDDFIGQVDALDWIAYSEGQGSPGETSAHLLRLMASGYRHRPGFNPDWVGE